MNTLGRLIKAGEEVYVTNSDRVFVCDSGKGLSPSASGTNIFGHWKDTGEKGVISGAEISVAHSNAHQAKTRFSVRPARLPQGRLT